MWVFRTASVVLLFGVVVSEAACKSVDGRLCIFSASTFSIICPLGFLSVAFASKSLLPLLWPAVGAAVVLIILLGRFFCAWICPGSIIQTLKDKIHLKTFQTRITKQKPVGDKKNVSIAHTDDPTQFTKGMQNRQTYSGLAFLIGALASSYLFGFPVFCLICPVGLTFGMIYAVIRLFSGAPPGFEILVFPVLIVVEFFLLKSWCRSICPLGALHGLISKLNLFFRLAVRKEDCLAWRGINCHVCEKACLQGVSLAQLEKGAGLWDCTKCLECYEKCPTKSIVLNPL